MSRNNMTARIAFIHHHSANDRERLESLFPVARELIEKAMVILEVEYVAQSDAGQRLRDTFVGDAKTFLDATRLLSKDAEAADRRRVVNEAGR